MFKFFARDKPDLLKVTRQHLLGVTPQDVDIFEGKEEGTKRSLLKQAFDISENEVFKLVIRRLLESQAKYIAEQSANWDDVLVARGTLNGIRIVEETFEEIRGHYEDLAKPTKPVNKYDII
jgi:hypothetical protein